MKKIAALIAAGIMAVGAALPVFGEQEIGVYVDGIKLFFDQAPVIQNDRTLVPMRAIFEAMGAEVEWIAQEQRVNAFWGKDSLDLWIGKNEMKTGGGRTIKLDAPAQIINSRTMVPLRAVSEAMEAAVEWEPVGRNIYISRLKGNVVDCEDYEFSFLMPEGFYVEEEVREDGIEGFVMTEATEKVYLGVILSSGVYDVKGYYDKTMDYINTISDAQLDFARIIEGVGCRINYTEGNKYVKTIYKADGRGFEYTVYVEAEKDALAEHDEITEMFIGQFGV